MSLSDPLSVTISGVTTSLPRTGDMPGQGDGSVYTSGDGLLKASVSHTSGNRTRRMFRIDASKITADPFKPAENVQVSMANYIVFDLPKAGYSPAEALAVWKGFVGLLTASSDAAVIKFLGGES